MKLTMNTRREIVRKMAPEYQRATKREKRKILDELIHLKEKHHNADFFCYIETPVRSSNSTF